MSYSGCRMDWAAIAPPYPGPLQAMLPIVYCAESLASRPLPDRRIRYPETRTADGGITVLSTNVLYYGRDVPLPDRIPLRAGPLALIYEAGALRAIRTADQEVVRGIYVAVRDHNWDTIAPIFSDEQIQQDEASFQITFTAAHRQDAVDFVWRGEIRGDTDGTVTYRMTGEARATFQRNRIGFCILHPADVTGQTCRIEHMDGTQTESQFPRAISPHQPFFNMRSIAHRVTSDLWARLEFDGDTFEMEDQRNWTDASYKTYCTPLALPFPVTVEAGTTIAQSVTLTLAGDPPPVATAESDTPISFALDRTHIVRVPRLGLGVASHDEALSAAEIRHLRRLNLSHLRVDLHLADPGYVSALRRAHQQARQLGASLEIALFVTDNARADLAQLSSLLHEELPQVCRWLIFHEREKSTSAQWVALARAALADYYPAARIGAGTNAYFTELNRERPDVEQLEVVAYSLNPQVHAFDNVSLVETLAAQAVTVQSARTFVGDTPIAISPVTLRPRFNPNATGPAPEPAPDVLPPQVDPRQMSLFGAGWTLGSLKYLSESGVHSITYYETTGWRGVMEVADGSPQPQHFPSIPGSVFPLYHVLADVADFFGGEIIRSVSSDPLRVDGLVLHRGGHVRGLLANFTDDPQLVALAGWSDEAHVRLLDASNAEQAMREPEAFHKMAGQQFHAADGVLSITLPPFGLARIDQ